MSRGVQGELSRPQPAPKNKNVRRSKLCRAGALGAGFLLLTAALVPKSIDETSARWESEEVVSATMTALTIAPVRDYGCKNDSVILGLFKSVTLSWTGADVTPGARYKIVITNRSGQSTTRIQNSSSISIDDNLLNDLLGALLTKADTMTVNVATKLPGDEGWESAPSIDREVDYVPFLLGLGGFTCG
jgi:hypothetical protein